MTDDDLDGCPYLDEPGGRQCWAPLEGDRLACVGHDPEGYSRRSYWPEGRLVRDEDATAEANADGAGLKCARGAR